MVELPHDRMPGGTEVPMFRETASGPMPDTEVWSAIKKGSVRLAKTLPGIGSAKFVAYQLGGEYRYAVIRILDSGFQPPAEHQRYIIEAFPGYESAVTAMALAVSWLLQLAEQYGPGALDEDLARLLEPESGQPGANPPATAG
jgi:hypothetical protein